MKEACITYFKIILFCWYFPLVNGLFSNLVYEINRPLLVFGLAMGVLLSLPAFFIRQRIRIYLLVVYFFLLIPALIQFIYLLLYHKPVVGEYYYPLFEAQPSEIREFAGSHIGWKWLLVILFAALPLLFLPFIHPLTLQKRERTWLPGGALVFMSAFFFHFGFDAHSHRIYNYQLDLIVSWRDFKSEKERFKEHSVQRKSREFHPDIQSTLPDTAKQVYVIVIGESTSRRHMSLYGYHRRTDPELESIRNELLVFNNVVSPYAHTIPCLRTLLTFATRNDTAPLFNEPSLIALLNAAGFDTWWLSNQPSLGMWDTEVSVLANEAHHTIFISDSLWYMRKPFDEAVLPGLGRILVSKGNKKMIFIHLMGAHEEFYLRFPPAYNVFKDSTGIRSPFPMTKEKIDIINSYDNALLYGDHIVKEIIERVRKTAPYSYVLYLSDHGEEVYDVKDMYAHAGYDPSPPMFEVPFVLWMSDAYRKGEMLTWMSDPGKEYNTEDAIHSILSISGLKTDLLDSSKSLFTPFKRERLVE
jgi:heptose-I-phosphate ethanolaminephosphotransferase